MSAPETVTQCELRDGDRLHVAWLPSRHARRGAVLRIDSVPGRWVVVATYSTQPLHDVSERSRDHARQREFSDA